MEAQPFPDSYIEQDSREMRLFGQDQMKASQSEAILKVQEGGRELLTQHRDDKVPDEGNHYKREGAHYFKY